MDSKPQKGSEISNKVSRAKLVASVGVGLLATHHELADLDPNEWYSRWKAVVDELSVYSSVLGALYDSIEGEVGEVEVELPKGMYCTTVPNPYYVPPKRKPRSKDKGDLSAWGDLLNSTPEEYE